MLTTAEEVADRLRLAVGRLARRLRQQSMGGLTPSQRSVLATLYRHGPLAMSELADIEQVSRPSVTRIADRLVESDLVGKRPHPLDGRSTVLELTAPGRKLLEEGREERTAFLVTQMGQFTEEERHLLMQAAELLDRLGDGA